MPLFGSTHEQESNLWQQNPELPSSPMPSLSSPYGFRLQVGTRGFNLGGPDESCKKA